MKERLQRVGALLAGMVVPNIGAFIAWGLLTALFIPSGWMPNERLARLVTPTIMNLLPILIGFTGGRLVYGIRGGVVGAVATMGAVVGSGVPMFLGAMILGPLGGWLIKRFDAAVASRVPAGFEMLVNNFSAGIAGLGLTLLAYTVAGPAVEEAAKALGAGAKAIGDAGLLPLIALLIEPGKVLFVNNAINHGVLAPLGIAQAKEFGRSIFFLLETNPGPGLGLLVAYWLFGKGAARQSSPGAIVIQFFGGIHEMYFPYVLMNPLTILAVVAGGVAGDAVFVAAHAGLVATPSPGSIFAEIAMTPKGGLMAVLGGIFAGAATSCLVAAPLVRRMSAGESDSGRFDRAQEQARERKAGAAGAVPLAPPAAVFFVCEAGMGSSVMGASILKRRLQEAGLAIEVRHAAIGELPAAATMVVSHRALEARVKAVAPGARTYPVDEFIRTPVYDELIWELLKRSPE